MERLDKRLASTGRWSRKEARELIRAGRVTADGQVCRAPEEKVGEDAPIQVDGADIGGGGPVYLMMNKPAGLLSATEDARFQTVTELLPAEARRDLFPVGSLDRDTEGLLLLTNNGPLGHRLLAPGRHVDKVYLAQVEGRLDQSDAAAFRAGMTLEDGLQCLPAELEVLEDPSAGLVTLREGKYHQVKRMLAARGKPVRFLKRLSMGPLTLDPALEPGEWRPLTVEERSALEELE